MKLEGQCLRHWVTEEAILWPSLDYRSCFGCCCLWVCFIGMAWWCGSFIAMATTWLWAPTFANRERQKEVKADETQAGSSSSHAAGLDVYLLATALHLCRMEACWLVNILLCPLYIKGWIVLACQIHMWSYLETGSLQRKLNYNEAMRMGSNPIGVMFLYEEEIALGHRQREDHVRL